MRVDDQAQNYSFINARIQRLFFRSNHFEEKNPQIFNENAERDAVIDSSSNCKGDQKDMISLDIISSADAADQIIDVETRESDF